MATPVLPAPPTVPATVPSSVLASAVPRQRAVPRTLLVATVAGAARLVEALGPVPAQALLRRHRDRAAALAQERDGRVVEASCDGVLLSFADPAAALESALALQEASGPLLRLAAHRVRGSSATGTALAVQLGEVARTEEVLVSDPVRRAVAGFAFSARRRVLVDGRVLLVSRLLGPQVRPSASTASNALRAAMSTGSQTGENGGA